MPGDDLCRFTFTATRAITIEARPSEVWPWLTQVGISARLRLQLRSARRPRPPERHGDDAAMAAGRRRDVAAPMASHPTPSTSFRVTDAEPQARLVCARPIRPGPRRSPHSGRDAPAGDAIRQRYQPTPAGLLTIIGADWRFRDDARRYCSASSQGGSHCLQGSRSVTIIAARPGALRDQVIRRWCSGWPDGPHRLGSRTSYPLGARVTRHRSPGSRRHHGGVGAPGWRSAGRPDSRQQAVRAAAAWTVALDRALQAGDLTAASSRTLTATWPRSATGRSWQSQLFRPGCSCVSHGRGCAHWRSPGSGSRLSSRAGGSTRSAATTQRSTSRCPIAAYLLSQGAAGVCVAAWAGRTARWPSAGHTAAPYRNAGDRRSGLRLPL